MPKIATKLVKEIKTTKQIRTSINESDIVELADNIKENGLLQPITIDDKNCIIYGERRYRACKLLKMDEIDCIVMTNVSDIDRIAMQLSENIQRKEISGYEAARAMDLLWKKHVEKENVQERANSKGVEWLSQKLGKQEAWVSQLLSLLDEPKEVQDALQEAVGKDKLPYSYVLAANLAPEEHQEALKKKIVDGELTGVSNIRRVAKELRDATDQQVENLMGTNYSILDAEEFEETIKTIMQNSTTKVNIVFSDYKIMFSNVIQKLEGKKINSFSVKEKVKMISLVEEVKQVIDTFLK